MFVHIPLFETRYRNIPTTVFEPQVPDLNPAEWTTLRFPVDRAENRTNLKAFWKHVGDLAIPDETVDEYGVYVFDRHGGLESLLNWYAGHTTIGRHVAQRKALSKSLHCTWGTTNPHPIWAVDIVVWSHTRTPQVTVYG